MRTVITAVALLVLATTTVADTIDVPGDYTVIQDAINASNNGDVIDIAPGTYNESVLNPGGKAITIQGTLNGDGSLATTIDSPGNSVFVIVSGEGSGTVIQDLIITGGYSAFGGGIYCSNFSSPTISGCTISGNTADNGGGIYCMMFSDATISGCTISDNTAINDGGGIICSASNLTISDCTISDNTANRDGGGIICKATGPGSGPTISDCTISGNTANRDGGAIFCEFSNPAISGCTISDNTANDNGGGIYNINGSGPTISVSVICGNAPDQVYGIGLPEGSLASDSCDIVSNTFGACCLGGTCITATESDCTAAGGTYAGDDVACGDAGCAAPCVGDINNDGEVGPSDLALLLGAWGVCP